MIGFSMRASSARNAAMSTAASAAEAEHLGGESSRALVASTIA